MRLRIHVGATVSLLVISIFSPLANAGVYLEPMAGYHMGNTSYKVKSSVPVIGGQKDEGTVNGIDYGVGLGWHFDFGLVLGADANLASLESKYKGSTAGSKSNLQAAYFIVGIVPKPQPKGKAYVGLGGFSATNDSTPKTTTTGTAAKAGVSYEFFPHVALNVEYVAYLLEDTQTSGSAKQKISDIFEKNNYTAVMWNVRFPFEFGGKGR